VASDPITGISHRVGVENSHENDGNVVTNSMEATLDPGVRKLDNWTDESDLFFASLEEDTELLSF